MNKYLAQRDGSKNTVTILTGKVSYTEAFERTQAMNSRSAPPLEWVDEKGHTIMKLADVKVIRPMPVSCDNKTTGVVLSTTFLSARSITGTIYIKFDENNIIALDRQGP